VVEQITAARAALAVEGWDNGATSIYHRLVHDGGSAPSPRTIHRVLVRAGLVVPQPKKRPRSSYRRFQFPCTDDCWQIDGWQARLADGTAVVVLDVIDDCSRYLLASYVCDAETTRHAWTCISQAIDRQRRTSRGDLFHHLRGGAGRAGPRRPGPVQQPFGALLSKTAPVLVVGLPTDLQPPAQLRHRHPPRAYLDEQRGSFDLHRHYFPAHATTVAQTRSVSAMSRPEVSAMSCHKTAAPDGVERSVGV
jgi:hypothetical protein